MNRYRMLAVWLGVLMLAACASMPTDFEEPGISISNIALRNSTGLTPQFDITLHITNPNRDPLDIAGMSYDIYLEGNKVVSGVSSQFPVIEAYSEADVSVSAMVNIIGGINLLRELSGGAGNTLDYELAARLDIGRSHPRINIKRSGLIRLR